MEHEPPSSPRQAQPTPEEESCPPASLRRTCAQRSCRRRPAALRACCKRGGRGARARGARPVRRLQPVLALGGAEARHGVVVPEACAPHKERGREGGDLRGTAGAGSVQETLAQALECSGDWCEVGRGSSSCASGCGCTQGLSERRACQRVGFKRLLGTHPTRTVRDVAERSIFTEKPTCWPCATRLGKFVRAWSCSLPGMDFWGNRGDQSQKFGMLLDFQNIV